MLLRKIPWFHLISWCANFAKRHSFHTMKLGEITVFYAVFSCRPNYYVFNSKTRSSCLISFEKTCARVLLFNKVPGCRPKNLLKRESGTFSWEFCNIFSKKIHQIDSKNEWLLLLANLREKLGCFLS